MVSEKNDYIETTRPLVVITAPGPGSGKMATCLSQLYHENKRELRQVMLSLRHFLYGTYHLNTLLILLTRQLQQILMM